MIVMIFKDSISTGEVKIESFTKDSILTSLLSFKLKNNWVKVNNFEIDLKNAVYREKMTFLVGKMAQILKNRFSVFLNLLKFKICWMPFQSYYLVG